MDLKFFLVPASDGAAVQQQSGGERIPLVDVEADPDPPVPPVPPSDDTPLCSICLSEIDPEDLTYLDGCQHPYHFACIHNFWRNFSGEDCPICRVPFQMFFTHNKVFHIPTAHRYITIEGAVARWDHIPFKPDKPLAGLFAQYKNYLIEHHSYHGNARYFFRGVRLQDDDTLDLFDNLGTCEEFTAGLELSITFTCLCNGLPGYNRTIGGWTYFSLASFGKKFSDNYAMDVAANKRVEFEFFYHSLRLDPDRTLAVAFWKATENVVAKVRRS